MKLNRRNIYDGIKENPKHLSPTGCLAVLA